ncbi:hypothetical protein GCM10022254_33770 [Actinomadura meridiana]|uniref:TetR family transcriptional regulator n=1 Tax=Actinomadura meridiana TaxID=559626 RepID=A0ABP8C3X0_9ACTN
MNARERLVESTRELLWERGYVGTSPKAIQQRSGAGQGSMYHHFASKEALARAAIDRTADDLRTAADELLSAPGTAIERVAAYLHRERDVLRGCPIGRLTQDPDVMATPALREPVEETFAWLRGRLAEVLREGVDGGELSPALDPAATASAIVACLQGGYVLARAADTTAPFDQAIEGTLALLRLHAVVTHGIGRVQGRGGAVSAIRAGDTVRIAPGEWQYRLADDAENGSPVVRSPVLDQFLAEPHNTHRVEVRRITIAPGHAAGRHVHNGPVFGSIETGSVVYQIEGVTFLGYFLLAADEKPEIEFIEQ